MNPIRYQQVRLGLAIGVLALVSVSLIVSPPAHACGVSTADGLSACSLQEHEEATRHRWRVGASSVYTSTTIGFGDLRSDQTRSAVVASLGYQPSRRTTFQLAIGSTLGGQLSTPTGRYDFLPGPTAALGVSWRLDNQAKPFVILTSNLSFSVANTQPSGTSGMGAGMGAKVGYDAFDLRLGILVGTTFLRVLHPYAVARVFGGPVYWQYQDVDVRGGDVHHYQIGVGLTVEIVRRVDLFAEGVPLGERSLSAGAAVAF